MELINAISHKYQANHAFDIIVELYYILFMFFFINLNKNRFSFVVRNKTFIDLYRDLEWNFY